MGNKRIALTGSIATGKTTVANRLRELGAIILDADEYARRVVAPGLASHAALKDLVGPGLFERDGTLKRGELHRKIIREPDLRQRIDAVLHPFISSAMREEWKKQKELNPDAVIVFDIPLLFEAQMDRDYDIIILVYSAPEVQLQRLMDRDNLTRSDAELTVSMQFPIDSKKARSDYIIENSGDIGHTIRQVDEVWEKISKQ